ncbi:hypothetical protein N7492_005042 [Penicillium capsulatum]|uniref:Xylanolytic transcriptional activator regulatory domain-containing protein n=1 Tax=Penicillium capsulatum TaxID=69766 RepID=A0A9W9LQL4_9EURO|nr:hypothetical protein N7492_005042 [Penicillium capsulatum]KAJ6135850.1 hypothetical protein N7512_001010 [Penicillium capsulatum]
MERPISRFVASTKTIPDTAHQSNGPSASPKPDKVFLEACHIYFRHCHNKPYGFFSARLFHQKVSRNEVPLYLRLALIASATRYSSRSQWQERKQSTIDSYAKCSWELIMNSVHGLDDNADVTVIQTLALLALIDATAGRRRGAWVKIGMAVRISQDLQMMLEPDSSFSDLERDERRNLFWSLYLLDRFVCCAFARPPVLNDSDCRLNLPTYSEPEAGFTVTSLHEMLDEGTRDISIRPGMFGISIGLSSVLGRTVKCMMNEGPRAEAPWQPHSQYSAIYADLEYLKELAVKNGPVLAAPDQPRSPKTMPDPDREQIAHMVLSHTLYHLSHCILGHPYLLSLKISKVSRANMPATWLEETRTTCLAHAGALITILVEAKAAGYMPVPSFYSYCILVASTVQGLYLYSEDVSTRETSAEYLQTSLQYLGDMSELWENAHIMASALKSFTSQCARCSDILLHNEPRIESLTPTESAILRSVVDYWEMMDPRKPVFDRTSVKPSDFPALPVLSPGYITPPSPSGVDSITLGVNNPTFAGNAIDPDIVIPCTPRALSPMISDGGSPRWDWDNELDGL